MKNKVKILLITLLIIILPISGEIIHAENNNAVVATDTGEQTSSDSLSISTSGSIIGYNKDLNPFHPKLIIPESKGGITINEIANGRLKGQGLTEVVLPDTITYIGESAFENNQITKINFPSGNLRIRDYAFKNNAFTEMTITSNMDMSSLGSGVFSENAQLKSVTFGEGVTLVPASIVKNSPVENVKFSDTVKKIDQSAFWGTKIENITLPSKLEKIYSTAFYQSKLKEVVIPDSVIEIWDSAFQACQLEKVVLSKNLQIIKDQCFGENKIKEVDIPASLKIIAARSFWQNEIEKVTFHEGLEVIDDSAFCYNKIKKVDIPKGTKQILALAFGQNEIESVTIGEGVEKVSSQAFILNKISSLSLPSTLKTVGYRAFAANKLGYVNLPSGVTALDAQAFLQQKDVAVEYVVRDGKYIYQLPEDIDTNQITEVKGYVDATIKNGDFNVGLKQFTSTEPLTKITYNVNLSSDTVSTVMDVSLVFSIQKHHVIFKDYNGSILNELDIEDGQSIDELPKVSRDGYTFIGWDHSTVNIQDDMTIIAQYKKLPIITVKDVNIVKGSSFNPQQYIKAVDADGSNVKTIVITKNTVNTLKSGTYIVEFKVTDKWGGTVTSSYKVYVEEDFNQTQIVDSPSQVTASGTFQDDTKLIVSLVENKDNVLYDEINNQTIVGSYEVKIIGNYKGKIEITFPIEMQYEGYKVYIRHMKHDGSVELFTRIAKNGKVSVEVQELSPFIITIDKPIINEGGASNNLPSQKDEVNDDLLLKKDEVKTSDQTSVIIWIFGMFIAASLITNIYLKRKNEVE